MPAKITRPTHPSFLSLRAAGSFDFPTTQVGATTSCVVYYDPALGQPGLAAATALLGKAQALYDQCQAWFADTPGAPVNAILCAVNGAADGTGGAYHYSCDFTSGGDLYIDMADDPAMVAGLFVAELVECFMGAQGKGWDCGGSGGEALSRFLAETVSGGPNGALAPFATAPAWDQANRPNWIDTAEATDQNPISTGCGIVYLYWMSAGGHTTANIVKAGGATLAANYQALTGASTAWLDMTAALANVAIGSDNPFVGAPVPPPQPPSPPPPPSPPTPPSPPSPPPPTGDTKASVDAEIDAFAAKMKSVVGLSSLP